MHPGAVSFVARPSYAAQPNNIYKSPSVLYLSCETSNGKIFGDRLETAHRSPVKPANTLMIDVVQVVGCQWPSSLLEYVYKYE